VTRALSWGVLALLLACAATPDPPAEAPPAPTGTIGGEPILPRPTVVGAISADAVEAGIAALGEAVPACWTAPQPGKVLVKFVIATDGTVRTAAMRSTTVRHPPTEDCLVAAVQTARFPPLPSGTAVVHYPFVTTPR
jgi:hypothetical protein